LDAKKPGESLEKGVEMGLCNSGMLRWGDGPKASRERTLNETEKNDKAGKEGSRYTWRGKLAVKRKEQDAIKKKRATRVETRPRFHRGGKLKVK